jgi:hypothetical protein
MEFAKQNNYHSVIWPLLILTLSGIDVKKVVIKYKH